MAGNLKAAELRRLLAKGEFILAPGIYDGISARVADGMGFPALYMTGYGATASMLGLPDAGLATYSDMVGRAEMICSVVEDAADRRRRHRLRRAAERAAHGARLRGGGRRGDPDRGPGDAQEVRPHARPPRRAGRGDGDEDPASPPTRGAMPKRMIVARTDARTAHGLDEALRRAKLYEEAGADVIFVELPESEAELERIGKEVSKPLLANMVEFGKTPRVEADRLKKWGFDIAIYPGLGFSVAAEAMRQAWVIPQGQGHQQRASNVPQYRGMHELMGFPEVWDFEKTLGIMNGKQFLEMLARLPARVWLQAILGLIGFVVLAVLGFAVIAGVAALVAGRHPGLQGAAVVRQPVHRPPGARAAGAPGPQGDRRAVRDRRPPQGRRAALVLPDRGPPGPLIVFVFRTARILRAHDHEAGLEARGPGKTSTRPLEAVDHEVLAGDEAGLGGGEEGHELGDVGGRAQTVEHDALLHLLAARTWSGCCRARSRSRRGRWR